SYAETTLELLADLEHEFRVPRHSVWLGFTAREHEPDLQVPACRGEFDFLPLARWPNYGFNYSTDHRFDERPHLEPSRSPPSLLSHRRDSREHRSVLHARFVGIVDGCRTALDSRCKHQHHDGTVPSVRR